MQSPFYKGRLRFPQFICYDLLKLRCSASLSLESDLVLILFFLSFFPRLLHFLGKIELRTDWEKEWFLACSRKLKFIKLTSVLSAAENFKFLPVCWHNLWYDCLFWGIKSFLEIGGALLNKIIKKVSKQERTLEVWKSDNIWLR